MKTFLLKFKEMCPEVGVFITDNDSAEIEAITEIFPRSRHILCWWHVLKCWRKHLPRPIDPDLWGNLVQLLKSKDLDFERRSNEIITKAPSEYAEYLNSYYRGNAKKWAGCFRQDIGMFRKTNSNMLIESFHNILKTKFFRKAKSEIA